MCAVKGGGLFQLDLKRQHTCTVQACTVNKQVHTEREKNRQAHKHTFNCNPCRLSRKDIYLMWADGSLHTTRCPDWSQRDTERRGGKVGVLHTEAEANGRARVIDSESWRSAAGTLVMVCGHHCIWCITGRRVQNREVEGREREGEKRVGRLGRKRRGQKWRSTGDEWVWQGGDLEEEQYQDDKNKTGVAYMSKQIRKQNISASHQPTTWSTAIMRPLIDSTSTHTIIGHSISCRGVCKVRCPEGVFPPADSTTLKLRLFHYR